MDHADASGSGKGKGGQVGDFLEKLNLHEDEQDDFIWEEEVSEPLEAAKWLAIAKVHTTKGFSPTALYSYMRYTWNPPKEVIWRKIEDNLFTSQFRCLADWDKAMNNGPCLFRN
jgi:hypothetical protein